MTQFISESEKNTLRRIFQTEYASLYYDRDLKLVLCVAEEEYIPMDGFKYIFSGVTGLMRTFPVTSFAFDKRRLRTFHQPSMEWYFAIWKPAMRDLGLVNHYKILPDLEWFVKAVEAGKWEIFQKYGTELLDGIQVSYANSVDEVIESIRKTK